MSQLIDDLKATKAYLRKHGRCTGDLLGLDGKACLLGAIGAVTVKGFVKRPVYISLEKSPRANNVIDALLAHIHDEHDPEWHDKLDRVYQFNDNRRAGMDMDVYNVIDKALADLGGLD